VKLNATFAMALILLTASAFAQTPAKPGPELKKLDYFAGTWIVDATIDQGPWGNGGKFSATHTNEWMSGNFFLVGRDTFSLPAELGGDGAGTAFLGYDTNQNVYTSDSFNSQGRHESYKGAVTADTWIWTGSQNYAGQEIQHKLTLKVLSPSSYSMKLEVSVDGTNWMTFMDGKATKK